MNRTTNYVRTARQAGILYLVIIVSGIFAEFFVRSGMIVAGDAAITAANIRANPGLFRLSIAADLIMIMSDVAIGVLFYVLLRPVDNTLALMTMVFRLAQAATLAVNLLSLFVGLALLDAQFVDLSHIFVTTHAMGYALGLAFFAVNLLIVGWLFCRAGYLPTVLGVGLIIAAIGYLADSFARTILTNYSAYQGFFDAFVFTTAFAAELATCVWLLVRGVKRSGPAPAGADAA